MKPVWSKPSPSTSVSTGNSSGMVVRISRPRQFIDSRPAGFQVTIVSNRSSTIALNPKLATRRQRSRRASERRQIQKQRSAVEVDRKPVQPIKLGFARGVGIGLFSDRPNCIDPRPHNRARVKGESQRAREENGGRCPREPRRSGGGEIEGQKECDDPGNVPEQVVARKDGAYHLARLRQRNSGTKHGRGGEKGKENDTSEPTGQAKQVDKQCDYHRPRAGRRINAGTAWRRPAKAGARKNRLQYCARRSGLVPQTASRETPLPLRCRTENRPGPDRRPSGSNRALRFAKPPPP